MKFINIHTHTNSDENFSILNCYPNSTSFNTPFSIGIHPWFILEEKIEDEVLFIKKKLLHKNCYAIGECGLDKLSEVNYALQIPVFKEHVKLSEEFKKPLIIHCVKAFQDILRLKKELKPTQKWIIHGFNKNSQVTTDFIKNDCFLSFGKALLTSTKLQEVFLNIPLDKIFLETDDAKIDISTVYEKASNIKKISMKKLQKNIHQNFNTIFTK
ncbi:TatD family hydrolase [Tenacibaculum dicentrarchi]|uniref:TatD family hydrolase n=1 Tax=Tenacibaculum dicentrarchi TaxID=669041 RepID=UPI003517E24B